MPFDPSVLAGKHALVTGGARGIGFGIAQALRRHGARLSIVSRNPQQIDSAVTAVADIADEEQVAAAFARARSVNGPIEILVNNSGISDSAPLVRTSTAMWERIIATNLTGTFLCSRLAAADMIAANWGRILNVASTAGLAGAPYISAYVASKHGVIGFTRAIATELAQYNITVNAVCPGYTETDMMHQALEKIMQHTGATETMAREALAKMNPGERLATVEEVAEAALEVICGTQNGVAVVVPGLVVA